MSKTIYIVSAARTPIGAFQGSLSAVPAIELGATAIKSALERAGVDGDQVSEVIMGQVLTAGVGQAPARQAALGAGLPNSVPCMTINKVCGSGLKAVMLATDMIRLGDAEIVVAGGMENMTLSPHLMMNSRAGYRMGPIPTEDAMLKDGLLSPFDGQHMGKYTELCVKEYQFSREEQDEFAKTSYERAQKSQSEKWFENEICAVEVKTRKETLTITEDEEPGKARFDKMASLRPAFDKEGTITAANASKINDGACALVIASEDAVKKHGLKPLAKITAHATYAQDPKWFTTAPVGAMKKLFEKTGKTAEQVDLFEINEAFSAVTMAAMKDMSLPHDKVNVNGGAVAIGHPIGASGARILTTLVHALHTHNKQTGVAAICLGGGEGVSLMVEKA